MTETTVSDSEWKKSVKEVPVVRDRGFFTHNTGDTYDGFFEAKKKDRSVKMHGPGVYTTAEHEVYSGTWDGDKLGVKYDEIAITYPDNSRYDGKLKDWNYFGRGKYTYPDGSCLESDFVESCPVGRLILTDPNGQVWLGIAARGYGWVEPVNHFYNILEKTKDSIRKRPRSVKLSKSAISNKKTTE